MDVAKIKGKFPQEWDESLGMSSDEFQTLHQFIGSKWGTEYNEEDFIREARMMVPRQKALSVFFGVSESQVGRIIRGAPTKEVREIKVPLERIIEIENRLEKMTEMFEETLLQVKVKRIRPTHAEAKENEYVECDLQDMVILLEEAEKEDKDSFYSHWDILLKTSSTGELIDALTDVLQSNAKSAVSRFDEVFAALKNRAPFEQMCHHIDDLIKARDKMGEELDKSSEGQYPEDYMAFKEYVWEMFKAIHAIVTTFNPRMTKLMEKAREDAKTISGYVP